MNTSDKTLPIAHRVWTERDGYKPTSRPSSPRRSSEPNTALVFDCETTIDQAQALTFGVWHFYDVHGGDLHLMQEGIFFDDELPATDPNGFAILKQYVRSHQVLLSDGTSTPLRMMSRREFVEEVFFKAAYETRSRVIGFNLPFDLSRIAIGVTEGRGRGAGGFSLIMSEGKAGTLHRERKHRARVVIRHRDSKGAFIWFTKPLEVDADNLIPEGSEDGRPDKNYAWKGRFLDLRTFAYALTSVGYSLESAAHAFGVEGKSDPGEHGVITEQYVDYCRKDVTVTAELYAALMHEFEKLDLPIAPEQAYSPASIAKAYLQAMGVTPLLDRLKDFPPDVLGYAMSSFFGGRAECHIRRLPVPIALVDFTSMYPTVGSLMGLWRYVIARSIDVTESTEEIIDLLTHIDLESCFDPALWPKLVGFVLVEPDGDVLPVRAVYDEKTWGIGVNPVISSEPMWYSIADCVASTILTGRPPKVIRGVRLVPRGKIKTLRSVVLRGAIEVDPSETDPMRVVVEERQRIRSQTDGDQIERDRLSAVLKIIANAGSYGIYSEFNPRDLPKGKKVRVTVHGRKPDPFDDRVSAPEDPGKHCFPPLASCITAAARLMLALLECSVTDLGGTWAFCDTDSMAIVATEDGGHVQSSAYGVRREIYAITFEQVDAIREKFAWLNPYDHDALPGSILRSDAKAMCLAVSAKRYALFNLDDRSEPVFLPDHPPSEHGLGQFLNPVTGASAEEPWISAMWRWEILKALGRKAEPPKWFSKSPMIQTAISSPIVLRAFRRLNIGKGYHDQIKPFNFMLSASGAQPPSGYGQSSKFRLIAPWEHRSSKWPSLHWVDVHNPGAGIHRCTTLDGIAGLVRVDSFRDVADKYFTHPESKSVDEDGFLCKRSTIGMLKRRVVHVGKIMLIGKESNRIEERSTEALTINDVAVRLATYDDHDEWYRMVLPKLRSLGAKGVAAAVGMSERRARDIIAGRTLPHPSRQHWLTELIAD